MPRGMEGVPYSCHGGWRGYPIHATGDGGGTLFMPRGMEWVPYSCHGGWRGYPIHATGDGGGTLFMPRGMEWVPYSCHGGWRGYPIHATGDGGGTLFMPWGTDGVPHSWVAFILYFGWFPPHRVRAVVLGSSPPPPVLSGVASPLVWLHLKPCPASVAVVALCCCLCNYKGAQMPGGPMDNSIQFNQYVS